MPINTWIIIGRGEIVPLTRVEIEKRREAWDRLKPLTRERLGKAGVSRNSYRGVLHANMKRKEDDEARS